jgi:glucosamine--fructose-6-phosphate aminotransferase (isomerizing)
VGPACPGRPRPPGTDRTAPFAGPGQGAIHSGRDAASPGAGGDDGATRVSPSPSWIEAEIRSQPGMLSRLAVEAAPVVAELSRAVARRRPRVAVLAARGSSDHAAIYGKYLLELEAGLLASLAAPSVYSVYGRGPDVRDTLAIAISQSGQSPDIVATLDGARRGGALTLAVTNDDDSPLARAADLVLPLRVGAERSVPATRTFTAELLALWLLVRALTGTDPGPARRLGDDAGAALDAAERTLAGFSLEPAGAAVVVGRGYGFPVALEISLKLREVGLRTAQGFSAADLLHGPIAAVREGATAILVGAAGPTLPSLLECAAALRARGARILAITDAAELHRAADIAVPAAAETESLAAIPIVLAGQWLALQDAVAQGLDPDHPPGLAKVTRTI